MGGYEQAFAPVAATLGWPDQPPPLTGPGGALPSRLPVEDAAAATVGAALTGAAALAYQAGGRRPQPTLRREAVAAAFQSERLVRLDGEPPGVGFADLSRFWPSADGWVRTHANYPWHRDALLRALDSPPDVDAVAERLLALRSADVERWVTEAGGIAAAVRTEGQWRASHSPSPIVRSRFLGDAAARRPRASGLPASGVRVLDLTRVIAGPVGTRFLAALGADVLRLDPPHLPELPQQVPDGLLGKRSALLDLRTDGAVMHQLLDGADVLVHGYRPGALAAYGLDAESLAHRHPGLVVVQLSAWGSAQQRRGFDSIVQAACGIAMIESPDGKRPGALPCQALDHGTGYLVAAAALDGLRSQRSEGGTHLRTLSLAATADWLMSLQRPHSADTAGDVDLQPWLTTIGRLTAAQPPGRLDDEALVWPRGPSDYGADPPVW